MNQLKRQAVVRVLLAVIALTLVYAMFVGLPKARKLQRLTGIANRAGDAAQMENQLRKLQLEEAALASRVAAFEDQQDQLAASQTLTSPTLGDRAATPASLVRDVSQLMAQNRLTIVQDDLIDTPQSATAPEYLRTPPTSTERGGAQPAPRRNLVLWQVRFTGRYGDVTRMLESLARDARVVPAGLTMDEWPDGAPHRQWTLLIWLP